MATPEFVYQDPAPLAKDTTSYYKIPGSEKFVSMEKFAGQDVLAQLPESVLGGKKTFKDVEGLLQAIYDQNRAAVG